MIDMLRCLAVVLLATIATAEAQTFNAGHRRLTAMPDGAAVIPVALFYPSTAEERTIAMGPFAPRVAMNATPVERMKALIVVSHGTGGSELGHSALATALARRGYLVAALRHPGDDWQDRSLLARANGGYFLERPRQVSRVVDAVLAAPEWADRVARDSQGPRIGAVGHSAGGYTVLALAGAMPDVARVDAHCAAHRADDPVFCGVAAQATAASRAVSDSPERAELRDPRIRAVASLAPVGAVLEPASLAVLGIPTLIVIAGKDTFLVPRFHGERLASFAPRLRVERVAEAGHFAFMDKPTMPVPSEDGDVGADPAGFDRAAFLERLGAMLGIFFDEVFR
ncbi:MAG: dienelactone hydrolase [Alphaproteobacteria bacterium]|nr:dienelactone hydrolase [Alphaproteobacteria bacterium]